MLVKTNTAISYRCPECGSFEFLTLSIFELSKDKSTFISCRCKKSGIKISKQSFWKFDITLPCYACEDVHTFRLSRYHFVPKETINYVCPKKSIIILVIGSEASVHEKIDLLEQQYDNIVDPLGYEKDFHNSRITLDSLNHIHDIAEQGMLFCECGSSDLDISLHSHHIGIECVLCKNSIIIPTSTSEDLSHLLLRNSILLTSKPNKNLIGTSHTANS